MGKPIKSYIEVVVARIVKEGEKLGPEQYPLITEEAFLNFAEKIVNRMAFGEKLAEDEIKGLSLRDRGERMKQVPLAERTHIVNFAHVDEEGFVRVIIKPLADHETLSEEPEKHFGLRGFAQRMWPSYIGHRGSFYLYTEIISVDWYRENTTYRK